MTHYILASLSNLVYHLVPRSQIMFSQSILASCWILAYCFALRLCDSINYMNQITAVLHNMDVIFRKQDHNFILPIDSCLYVYIYLLYFYVIYTEWDFSCRSIEIMLANQFGDQECDMHSEQMLYMIDALKLHNFTRSGW